VLYALILLGVLAATSWISFSKFVLGKSLDIPDLTSLSLEEAQAVAAEVGLSVAPDPSKDTFDEKVPLRRIRRQIPAPGTAVKMGQTVRVSFSLGPHTIRVPELSGLTERTAALSLRRSGLQEGAVAAAHVFGAPGVVAQGVQPGTVTTPDAAVDVLLNRGAPEPTYVMPDLIGRDFDRVKLSFEARGFKLGGVKSQVYEGAAAGTILRQFPLAGFPVTVRDTLSFVVASPEPVS